MSRFQDLEFFAPLRDFPRVFPIRRESIYDFGTGWPSPPVATIPPLDVPSEPTPVPESASVVVLRNLLAERQAERQRVEAAKASRLRQAEEAEARAADLRKRIEGDDRHLSAADAAIVGITADIAKLTEVRPPYHGVPPFGFDQT